MPYFFPLVHAFMMAGIKVPNLSSRSFTDSKPDWMKLFGNIFNVATDRILLQHNVSSSEITVTVKTFNKDDAKRILNLMKDNSTFIPSINDEKKNYDTLKDFEIKRGIEPSKSKYIFRINLVR